MLIWSKLESASFPAQGELAKRIVGYQGECPLPIIQNRIESILTHPLPLQNRALLQPSRNTKDGAPCFKVPVWRVVGVEKEERNQDMKPPPENQCKLIGSGWDTYVFVHAILMLAWLRQSSI